MKNHKISVYFYIGFLSRYGVSIFQNNAGNGPDSHLLIFTNLKTTDPITYQSNISPRSKYYHPCEWYQLYGFGENTRSKHWNSVYSPEKVWKNITLKFSTRRSIYFLLPPTPFHMNPYIYLRPIHFHSTKMDLVCASPSSSREQKLHWCTY